MSMRDTMLGIAREAILRRAEADGYTRDDYNPEADEEGYTVSLLNALHHWTHTNRRDWTAELNHAQALFEDDLAELKEVSNTTPSNS
jgi:hypothetical protein